MPLIFITHYQLFCDTNEFSLSSFVQCPNLVLLSMKSPLMNTSVVLFAALVNIENLAAICVDVVLICIRRDLLHSEALSGLVLKRSSYKSDTVFLELLLESDGILGLLALEVYLP